MTPSLDLRTTSLAVGGEAVGREPSGRVVFVAGGLPDETVRVELIDERKSFARGIARDLAAVRSAIAEPWSNGQTEGHVNRLKLVKRQMYGRAKLDLLGRRFLLAA